MRAAWVALPLAGRLAVALWVVLLVGVTVRVLASKPRSQTVVPIYLVAGERWLAGEALYPREPGLDIYRYPPGFAAAISPLTFVSEKIAGVVWRLASTAIFLLALWHFRRDLLPELSPNRAGAMFAIAALLALPAVNNGQVNLLLAAAGLGGAAAMVRGRWWTAAAWFSLAGWLKIYPLAFGMLAALIAPRRLGPRLAGVFALGMLVPFLCQHPDYVLGEYRAFVGTADREDRSDLAIHLMRANRDWTVIARTWFDSVPTATTTQAVSLATAAACAGIVGWVAIRRERLVAIRLATVLGVGWATLFGPATEAHTYVIFAGIAAWLAVAPGPLWSRACCVTGCGLLATVVLRAVFPEDWRYTLLGPQPLGAALLLIGSWPAIANFRQPDPLRVRFEEVEPELVRERRQLRLHAVAREAAVHVHE